MTTTLPTIATGIERDIGVHLRPAGPALWRVLDPGGRIIGHLAALETPIGIRYDARRYRASAHALVSIGEFWSPHDAVDVLRRAG